MVLDLFEFYKGCFIFNQPLAPFNVLLNMFDLKSEVSPGCRE